MDFGYTNPFSCLWIAEHPQIDDDQKCECPAPIHAGFYVYREIFMSQRTTEEHAADIKFHTGNERISHTFADWAAGDRATLELHGVPTVQANKDISAGIQSVYLLFANSLLHIMKDCLVERDYSLEDDKGIRKAQSLEDEITLYKYPPDPSGKQSRLSNIKEDPLDKDNHAMDALRYIIHTLSLRNNFFVPVMSVRQPSQFSEFRANPWQEEGIFSSSTGLSASRWDA